MKKILVLGIAVALMLLAGTAMAEVKFLKLVKSNSMGTFVPYGDGDVDINIGAPFSSDTKDYSLVIAEDGSRIRQVFYGKFTEAVDDTKLAELKLYGVFVKEGVVMDDGSGGKAEFEIEMESCENFPSAGANAFRCVGKETDLDDSEVDLTTDEAIQELIGFYSHDLFNFQFRMGTDSSAYLWGRHFYFDFADSSDITDSDKDGVADSADNCKSFKNLDQLDTDEDGVGDVCDICIEKSDPDQLDSDHDGRGDACDPCPYDNSADCGVDPADDKDDEDAEQDLNKSEETQDLNWLSGTQDPTGNQSGSLASAAGGCIMVPAQPVGCTAFIMLALAMLPIAINRRK